MYYMVFAHHNEAQPFINGLKLKKDYSSKYFELYSSNECELVISGIGKLKSAAATSYILSRKQILHNTSIFNIGVCCTKNISYKQASLFLINKIKDHDTGRYYYPDMIAKTDIPENETETFSYPITAENKDQMSCDLADMEASGFYDASSHFIAPDKIHCLKVVFDFAGQPFDKNEITRTVSKNSEKIIEYILESSAVNINREILSKDDLEVIKSIKNNLHLTVSQDIKLINEVRLYKIRKGSIPLFNDMPNQPKSKQERKIQFDKLLSRLHQ